MAIKKSEKWNGGEEQVLISPSIRIAEKMVSQLTNLKIYNIL
jgi:hypothetical protein